VAPYLFRSEITHENIGCDFLRIFTAFSSSCLPSFSSFRGLFTAASDFQQFYLPPFFSSLFMHGDLFWPPFVARGVCKLEALLSVRLTVCGCVCHSLFSYFCVCHFCCVSLYLLLYFVFLCMPFLPCLSLSTSIFRISMYATSSMSLFIYILLYFRYSLYIRVCCIFSSSFRLDFYILKCFFFTFFRLCVCLDSSSEKSDRFKCPTSFLFPGIVSRVNLINKRACLQAIFFKFL
jgi:hypothetical protein